MIVTAVDSTTLATVAYDHRTEILRLEFRSGARYSYRGVPGLIHLGLLTAPSKGAYFNRNIRGRFRFQKLEPDHHPDVPVRMR
jgi:lysyl-tRNA synthetase class 2